MNQQLSILSAAVLALSVSASAQAATVVEWDLLGSPGNQATQAATSSATGITGGDIARGAGLGTSAATNAFSSAGWEGTDSGAAGNEYMSFGFSVAAGYELDLESLYIGTRSSGTAPGTLGLFWSGDNYATSLYTFTQNNTAYLNSVVDLSALSNLTGAVEFRLYEVGNTQADGSGATAGTGTFRLTAYFSGNPSVFDRNMQFTGTVAAPVPEADSYALILAGLGLVGLLARRRKG